MRLAIIAASSYVRCRTLAELLHTGPEVDLLSQRLSEPDARFTVHVLPAERGLSERMEQLVASVSKPIEALLVFFAGYAVVSDERGPALLLDGDRLGGLSLRRMRRLISQSSPSSLVVLDTISPPTERKRPNEVVRMLNEVLRGGEAGVHVLAANRPDEAAMLGPSPFTSLLALMLDWHPGTVALSPEGLFAAMRAEESLFSQIPSAELFAAPTTFELLAPSAPPIVSIPPPSVARPEPSDRAEARADAFVSGGDISAALAEFAEALDRLGPAPSVRHPALYSKIAATLRLAGRDGDALAYYDAALEIDGGLPAALQGAAELRAATGDQAAALTLLERLLTVDPNATEARKLARDLLTQAKRWERLAALDELLLARASDPAVIVELALELSVLCREALKAPDRARAALERAAALSPEDARVRQPLVDLCEKRGELVAALVHQRVQIRAEPRNAGAYRVALRLFERSGQADGAWNAASVLEVLGEADINESMLAGTHRPDGLLAVRDSLSDLHWKKGVFRDERDGPVDELFALLGDGVLEVGLETARRKRKLVLLDASTEQDPNTSTTTVAKTLAWAARLLGIPVPKLHVRPELSTAFLVAPAREPTLLVSKTLGSGLTLPQLAFLWSRQLVFLRPEHRPIALFPSVPELAALLLAMLSLGGVAQLPFKKLDGDAKLFARGLKRHLSRDALGRLESGAQKFPLREATQRMLAWARAVELGAGRAGLLACGDLELAVKTTRAFPLSGLAETEDQVGDLLAYSVSEEYAALRQHLGVAVQQ